MPTMDARAKEWFQIKGGNSFMQKPGSRTAALLGIDARAAGSVGQRQPRCRRRRARAAPPPRSSRATAWPRRWLAAAPGAGVSRFLR